ncbi:MAG: hypothetical protein ACO1RT_03405 [Planctomycetaceae bacterium]
MPSYKAKSSFSFNKKSIRKGDPVEVDGARATRMVEAGLIEEVQATEPPPAKTTKPAKKSAKKSEPADDAEIVIE